MYVCHINFLTVPLDENLTVNLNIKVSKILYKCLLLLNQFGFCETKYLHFTTHTCSATVRLLYSHPPSCSNCNLFCLGFQFVPRDLLHIPNSRKIFNVRMKVIFGEKFLSLLFRILRQDLTNVSPAISNCFTTAKGAEN